MTVEETWRRSLDEGRRGDAGGTQEGRRGDAGGTQGGRGALRLLHPPEGVVVEEGFQFKSGVIVYNIVDYKHKMNALE